MDPVIATDLGKIGGESVIDFSDLIEIRFLDAFRKYGVSARAIRIAALRAREMLGRPRPFSTHRFKTDGRTILTEILRPGDDRILIDLVRDQVEFDTVVSPLLYAGLEFNQFDEPERWWPLGHERLIVIDPRRNFGAPITVYEGVPTRVLADAVRVEGSVSAVASIYDVVERAVADAVDFEQYETRLTA